MKTIWLIQLAENLEIDPGARIMRTGLISQQFEKMGANVTLFSGAFNHGLKKYRETGASKIELRERFTIILLRCISYLNNLSVRRVISQTIAAIDFIPHALKRKRPDLILISYPSPELAASVALYARILRVPYVVDIRDAWPTIFNGYGSCLKKALMNFLGFWYGLLYKFILKGSKAVYSPSSTMIADAELYIGRNFENKKVYYLAYPDPSISPKGIPDKFTKDNPLVVSFVGTFGSSYDVPLLIDVARLLAQSNLDNIVFNIIGDGDCKEKWLQLAAGLSNVHFCGWLNANGLALKLSESHVGAVLYTSGTSEFTVPNKLGEYLAFGLVILNSLGGDVPKIIESNQIGQTIPKSDRVNFVFDWLVKLSRDSLLVNEHRERSLKLFIKDFSAESVYPSMCKDVLNVTQV